MYEYIYVFRSKSCRLILEHGWNVGQERREEFIIIKRKTVTGEGPISVPRKGMAEEIIPVGGSPLWVVQVDMAGTFTWLNGSI